MSKISVAIEISNIGPLKLSGDKLFDYYGNLYCYLSETAHYLKLENPFRGFGYYATFTDAQYSSLLKLLKFLTKRYNIPPGFLAGNKRFQTLSSGELKAFKGILSHVNFRNDKSDLSPAFDYEKLVGKI